MRKISPLFLVLPLLTLAGCGQQQNEKVKLLFGEMHGDVQDWVKVETNQDITDETEWFNLDYLHQIDYAGLSGLISSKDNNFIVISKGNENTCGCWQGFHASIAKYIKSHRLKVYVIETKDLVKGDNFFGLKCANGVDELAIFKDGKLQHSHTDEKDWGHSYLELADWMNERIVFPKMFAVNQDQLDQLYEGDDPFFIYYGRPTCGDCSYINATSLRDYLFSDTKVESYNFYFDITPWRSIIDDSGKEHGLDDKKPYDETMTWGEKVTATYNELKEEYGLADKESGYKSGVVPTFYRISPDGEGSKTGSVITMAGVFYNDSFENDVITDTYFTQERLGYAALDYLSSSKVENKVLTGKPLKEGTSQAKKERRSDEVHDAMRVYHEPIFYALLDAAIKL